MGCCLGVLGLMFPRIALVVMWVAGYGGRAFETMLWPLLGFFLMPYTTCAYAIAMNERGEIAGWGLALLILGVFFDLGSHGGSGRSYAHRRRRAIVRD
jgi:hypothetical protein